MSWFSDRSALHLLGSNRNIFWLFLSQTLSFVGAMMTGVALHYHIWSLTHSTMWTGMLSAVQLLCLLPAALWGGVLADRWNRKKLLLTAEITTACLCGIMGWESVAHTMPLASLLVMSGLFFTLAGLHSPSLTSIQQQLIHDPSHLMALSTLNAFRHSMGMIAGPAIAGMLITYQGVEWAYWMDASTFIFSIAALLWMRIPPHAQDAAAQSRWHDLLHGVTFAFKNKLLWGSYCVDFVAMVFAMPHVFFPSLAEQWHAPSALGALYAATAAGALITSALSGVCRRVSSYGKGLVISAVLWGLAIGSLGRCSSVGWAIACLLTAGVFDAASGIFRATLWNTIIPQAMRGRLAGIEMISYISGPKLGSVLGGIVAYHTNVQAWLIGGGMLCCIMVLCTACKFPALWRYRASQHHDLASTPAVV